MAEINSEAAELVKLCFFVGLTQEQAAKELGVSVSTVERLWAYARAWLDKYGSPCERLRVLKLEVSAPSSVMASPSLLLLPYQNRPDVEVIAPSDVIKQIKVPQGLVNVAVTDNHQYELQFYYSNNVTAKDPLTHLYSTNGNPFLRWIVQNPDNSQQLRITESRGGNGDRVYLFDYNTAGGWNLHEPNGLTTVSTYLAAMDSVTNYYTDTYSGNTLVNRLSEIYQSIPGLSQPLLLQQSEGYGDAQRTTVYTYYSPDPTNGASTNLLQRVDYPDGSWAYYMYDDKGRKTNEYSAYLNNPQPSAGARPVPETIGCKVTEYVYSLNYDEDGIEDAGNDNLWTIRKQVVKLPAANGSGWNPMEVSRSYTTSGSGWMESRSWNMPNAKWYDSGCVRRRTAIYYQDAYSTSSATNEVLKLGKPKSVSQPDGTVSIYDYQIVGGEFITSERTGELGGGGSWEQPGDISNIINGREIVTVQDQLGRILSKTTLAVVNGNTNSVLESLTYTYPSSDLSGRSFLVMDLGARIKEYDYSCCSLYFVTDPDGAQTVYTYDGLNRQNGTLTLRGSSTGLYITNVLDGAGRILARKRIGSNDSATQAVTIQQYQYDMLGRIIRSTNALGGVTTNLYDVTSAGGRREVTLNADSGTRTNDYYLDGRLQKVTGTAVAPVLYEYGIEQESGVWREYVKEAKLNASWEVTSEWTKTYTDGAGRSYKTVYAAPNEPYPFSASSYNDLGQISSRRDPDAVTNLYSYNGQGELAYSAVDLDGDGVIDTDTDRVIRTERAVLSDRIQTDTTVWVDVPNSGSVEKLASRREVSTDGLHTWQTAWREAGNDSTKAVTESRAPDIAR